MWAALNKQVGGLEICSSNSTGMTTATTLIWRERERERHTVERVGQDKDDLLDHWEKVLLEGIFLILCAITPILCKIEFK